MQGMFQKQPKKKGETMALNGVADVRVIEDKAEIKRLQSPKEKAFLRVTFMDGTQVDMSLNLAEMIGGISKGVQLRLGYAKESDYNVRD
jgi:hypothetical protein